MGPVEVQCEAAIRCVETVKVGKLLIPLTLAWSKQESGIWVPHYDTDTAKATGRGLNLCSKYLTKGSFPVFQQASKLPNNYQLLNKDEAFLRSGSLSTFQKSNDKGQFALYADKDNTQHATTSHLNYLDIY